jgi:uncharacterized protein (TIGR03067 family)
VIATPRVEYVGSLVISGRRFRRFQKLATGQVIEGERGSFVLNDARHLSAIDFNSWQGTTHGIFEIDGDTLTLCVTTNGAQRPDKFSTAMNDGHALTRYERVK